MADLTDMTLEKNKLWSSNAMRIYKSQWKNNIDGNYQNVFSFTRHLLNTHTRTYARTHAHTHAHIHIHAHTRTRTHSHTHVYGMFYFLLVPDKIEQRLQWFLFLWCSCPVDRATLCTRTDHKHKYDTQDDSGKRGGQVVHDGS